MEIDLFSKNLYKKITIRFFSDIAQAVVKIQSARPVIYALEDFMEIHY